jgi:thioredoxin 1
MKQLLVVSTSWCAPCKAIKPIMQELSQTYNISMVDAEANPEIASQYSVRGVPTVILLENGVEKNRFSGFKTREQIINFYNN